MKGIAATVGNSGRRDFFWLDRNFGMIASSPGRGLGFSLQATLEAANVACSVTRVETRPEFVGLLERGGFDLILADYTLPSFDGISALKMAKKVRPDVPFIFVSGTLGEEIAIEALKLGATDYVFKNRLARILPSVQRALREAEERTERKRAEEALRRNDVYFAEAQRLSHTGSFGWDVGREYIYWSEETFRIFEADSSTKPTVELVLQRTHPEDKVLVNHSARCKLLFHPTYRGFLGQSECDRVTKLHLVILS